MDFVDLIFRNSQNIVAQNDKIGVIVLFKLADPGETGHVGRFGRIKANRCFDIDPLILPEIGSIVSVSGHAALYTGERVGRLRP